MRVVPSGLTGALTRVARRAALASLEKLELGRITLVDGEGPHVFGKGGINATITVSDPRFYADLAFGGSISAAEAYMSGFWTADDLTTLVRIIVLNRKVLAGMEGGLAVVNRPIHSLLHWLRRNTLEGSRRNIAAHYDLGNDFYGLWLDRTMTYSCNIFEREDTTLEEAAAAKYERICRKLTLGPEDHVLEIGTGWGGFAVHAAKNCGCRVTTTTISRQQHDYAREHIRQEGLSARIELLHEDYRDLTGAYDKLVSIEMIEAVGHHFLDAYLRACSNRLKDDGAMALQAIIITDQVYEAQLRPLISSSAIFSQGVSSLRYRPSPDRSHKQRICGSLISKTSLRTTPVHFAPSVSGSSPAWMRYVRSASPTALSACGSTISATVRGPSWSATSATSR